MSEYHIKEIKGALSNTISSFQKLSQTVATEKIRTHIVLKKVGELSTEFASVNKRLDIIEKMIESSKKSNKKKESMPKEISIDN